MELMLLGALAMAGFTITLFFLRFWKTTHDRFFLFFAISFFIDGCDRVMHGLLKYTDEQEPLLFLLRIAAFLIILYAIVDKNRKKSAKK